MGYEPSRDEAGRVEAARVEAARVDAQPERGLSAAERQEVLEMLSRGEIDMEEAKRRLRGEQSA
jgi:hypothetical protein